MDSQKNSTKHLKNYNYSKIILEVTLPNSIYEATITLISKPDKNTKRRELQTKISDEHIDANFSANTCKSNTNTHQKDK